MIHPALVISAVSYVLIGIVRFSYLMSEDDKVAQLNFGLAAIWPLTAAVFILRGLAKSFLEITQ